MFSTNVTMLFTVVSTFFKFLLWYTAFIVAFAFSFYIMFHTDHKGKKNSKWSFSFQLKILFLNGKKRDFNSKYLQFFIDGEVNPEYTFFDEIGTCIVKTSAMFVGELEFSDIPFRKSFKLWFYLNKKRTNFCKIYHVPLTIDTITMTIRLQGLKIRKLNSKPEMVIYLCKIAIFVCLTFWCPIITQESLQRAASNFNWETR